MSFRSLRLRELSVRCAERGSWAAAWPAPSRAVRHRAEGAWALVCNRASVAERELAKVAQEQCRGDAAAAAFMLEFGGWAVRARLLAAVELLRSGRRWEQPWRAAWELRWQELTAATAARLCGRAHVPLELAAAATDGERELAWESALADVVPVAALERVLALVGAHLSFDFLERFNALPWAPVSLTRTSEELVAGLLGVSSPAVPPVSREPSLPRSLASRARTRASSAGALAGSAIAATAAPSPSTGAGSGAARVARAAAREYVRERARHPGFRWRAELEALADVVVDEYARAAEEADAAASGQLRGRALRLRAHERLLCSLAGRQGVVYVPLELTALVRRSGAHAIELAGAPSRECASVLALWEQVLPPQVSARQLLALCARIDEALGEVLRP